MGYLSVRYICIISLLVSTAALKLVLCHSAQPGVKVRLSQSGLQYTANVATRLASARIKNARLPDQGDVTGITVRQFSVGRSTITTQPIRWRFYDVSVSVHADWKKRLKLLFIRETFRGQADVTMRLTLDTTVEFNTDAKGHLSIRTLACQSDINNVNVKIHGGSILRHIMKLFNSGWENAIRKNMRNKVCELVTKEINNNAQSQLASLSLTSHVGDGMYIDYTLLSKPMTSPNELQWLHDVIDGMNTKYDCVIISTPVTSPEYIDFNLHCAYHHKTSVSERYSTPPLEVAEPDNSRMFHLWISEGTINRQAKFLVAAYTQDQMLTKSRLPEGYKTLLDIECPDAEFICIGNLLEFFDLLPADKNKRPTSTVVELTPTYVSDVHVSRDRLDVDMVWKIGVAPNDNHKTTLLDAEFHVTLVCDVRFDTTDGTLTLAYEFIKFDAQLTHISADIPLDTINNLIKMMLKQYPEYFQGTWAIPELLESAGVKVIKPTAELLPGMVYIAWDF